MEMFRLAFYPITGPLATAMNKLEGEQRRPEMDVLLLRSTRICTLLAFLGGQILLLHGKDILRIWMGAPYAAYYNLMVILTVGYIVMLMQQGSYAYLYARGGHKVTAVLALADGLANLGLSMYWAKNWGLAGVALGTTVPILIVSVFIQPWYTLRLARIRWSAYFQQAFLRPLIVASLALPCGLLIRWQVRANSLVKLGLVSSIESLLFISLAYKLSFDDYERRRTRQYVINLFYKLRLLKQSGYEVARYFH
jgi:O-antigen/teichoic acid export membrane protein